MAGESKWRVTLTTDELLLLDGQCSETVQAEIKKARDARGFVDAFALNEKQAELVAGVIGEAAATGRLVYRHTRIRMCSVCGKYAGYVKFKSGQNKGRDNTNKPISFDAIEMADRFIRMQGHVSLGGCSECMAICAPAIKQALSSVRAEIPAQLRLPDAPVFKKHKNQKCTECGWEGHEGQMRMLPAIMGGRYPGGCPACPADNSMFVTKIKTGDGFAVVEMEPQP